MNPDGLLGRVNGRLARGRVAAVARMASVATVRRDDGHATAPDGMESPAWTVVLSGVPFRLDATRSGSPSTSTRTVGDSDFQKPIATGHFPHDTTGLRADDLVEITAGEHVGAVYRIKDTPLGDQKTARRYQLEATTRPAGWG